MNRSTGNRIMIARILILLLALGCHGVSVSAQRLNVLFVSIDDLNDWVGVFGGHPQARTPNLDRFAANGGLVMMNAYAPSTVCGPSRSALLTGAHAHRTGVYGNRNNIRNAPAARDLTTLPEYFSEHGYHTLTMGKIFHSHPMPGGQERDNGQWAFEEYHRWLPGVGPESSERPVHGVQPLPEETGYHRMAFDWGPTKGNDESLTRDHRTATWAADQLNARDFDGRPFFMAVGFTQPHLQWYVPQKYFDLFPLDEVQLPPTRADDRDDIVHGDGRPIYWECTTWARMEKYQKHREAVRAYLAAVAFVDECVGVLLDGLEASPYADNTVVMLWSDHGWHLGEKQRYGKTLLWQESCRVPLMVKVPGVTPSNTKSFGVVNLIDLYPTLVELCGLSPNPENDGRSFAPLLHDPEMAWDEPTLTTWLFGNHRIYDGRYSYIAFRGGEELYDHAEDPMEWVNQARNPEFAEIKSRLKSHLPEHHEPESPRHP
jgi:arylsulfatase A-like enzyme